MELVTPSLNAIQYVYFKTISDRIHFNVKTKKAAHICLSNVANINQPFIEFVIEIDITDLSVIRLRNGNNIKLNKSVVRKNLLSESEYRGFWINFTDDGYYSLGCEDEVVPLMDWKDSNPFKINYAGVFSYQHIGHWKIELDKFKLPHWVAASNGSVPLGAIETGECRRGPHYIARVKHDKSKSFIPARLIPKYKCLYGFVGVELESKNYEVLCGGSGSWVKVVNGNIPNNAFACTDAAMKNKFFIGRAPLDNWLLSGKVYPQDGLCAIAYAGKEHFFGNYEIYVV